MWPFYSSRPHLALLPRLWRERARMGARSSLCSPSSGNEKSQSEPFSVSLHSPLWEENEMRPGPWQILICIAVVALLFGAKKIPEIARSLGRAKGEFKKGLLEGEKEDAVD